jgi:putative sigma-54 modulation protein
MTVHVTSRHAPLTAGLRDHVGDKIHRVEKYLGKIREAHVVLNFERKMHVCEINLSAKNLKLSAKAIAHDMYQAIDVAAIRLSKQAEKHKDKWVGLHKTGTSRSLRGRGAARGSAREETGPQVVRAPRYAVKPMSVEEAALQLSVSKDEFLVFYDDETGRTGVVYKRKDGDVGLIEPEY